MRRTAVVVVLVMSVVAAGRSEAGGRRSLFRSQPAPAPVEYAEEPAGPPQVTLVDGGDGGHHHRSCLGALCDWLCFRSLHRADHLGGEPCCHPPTYAFFLHRCNCCGCGTCGCRDDQAICIGFSYTSMIDSYIDHHGNGDCPNCK